MFKQPAEVDNESAFFFLYTHIYISDRVKAEMDLKELSETVQLQQQQNQQQQQQQGGTAAVTTPKRPIRSLDKTIESCKAQLGTFLFTVIFSIYPLELFSSSKHINLPLKCHCPVYCFYKGYEVLKSNS